MLIISQYDELVEAESPTAKADFPRDEDDEGQSFGGPG